MSKTLNDSPVLQASSVSHSPFVSIVAVLAASLLGAGGQFLFKMASTRGGDGPLGFLWTPWGVLGLISYLSVMGLFNYAFQRGGTVPVLYPVYATTFIWAAALAWAINGQPVRPIHVAGMVLLVAGIICMSVRQAIPS